MRLAVPELATTPPVRKIGAFEFIGYEMTLMARSECDLTHAKLCPDNDYLRCETFDLLGLSSFTVYEKDAAGLL